MLVAGVWCGLAWNAGTGDGTVPMVLAGVIAGAAAVTMAAAGRRLG